MTLTRDIMTPNVECIGENDALSIAAERMQELNVGALPICGEDGKLMGMLTDRDIVVKALSQGMDPETTNAGRLATGEPVTVRVDQDIEVVLARMQEHQVRRLPVMDQHRLVGIVSQADIARYLEAKATGETVAIISRP